MLAVTRLMPPLLRTIVASFGSPQKHREQDGRQQYSSSRWFVSLGACRRRISAERGVLDGGASITGCSRGRIDNGFDCRSKRAAPFGHDFDWARIRNRHFRSRQSDSEQGADLSQRLHCDFQKSRIARTYLLLADGFVLPAVPTLSIGHTHLQKTELARRLIRSERLAHDSV
jgi:hypothetical protein